MENSEIIHLMHEHSLELKTLLENQKKGLPFKASGFLEKMSFSVIKNEEATLVKNIFTQNEWDLMKVVYEKNKLNEIVDTKLTRQTLKI